MSGIDRLIEDGWAHQDNHGTAFEVRVGANGPLLSDSQVAEQLAGKLLNGSTHVLAFDPTGEEQGYKRCLLVIFDAKYAKRKRKNVSARLLAKDGRNMGAISELPQ